MINYLIYIIFKLKFTILIIKLTFYSALIKSISSVSYYLLNKTLIHKYANKLNIDEIIIYKIPIRDGLSSKTL